MAFGAYGYLPIRLGGSAEEGWSPQQHARLCADLVAIKRVSPLATLRVTQSSVSPFATSVVTYFGQNGSGLAYAPTVTVNGSGDVSLVWPSYWEDEYEQQWPVNIRMTSAYALVGGLGAVALLAAEIVNRSTVRIRRKTAAGAASPGDIVVKVW